jgi:hypothetical protein
MEFPQFEQSIGGGRLYSGMGAANYKKSGFTARGAEAKITMGRGEQQDNFAAD